MAGVESIYKEVNVKAMSTTGIDMLPQRQVELVFDVPEGVAPETVTVWQKYFDGSVLKLNAKAGEDGKVHLMTYRLGNFVIAYGNEEVTDSDIGNDGTTNEQSGANNKAQALPIVWLILGGVLVLAGIGAAIVVVIKVRRAKNVK